MARKLLRDMVRLSGPALATKAGPKALTLWRVYQERARFAREMANPPANVVPAWARPTRQSPPKPFETDGCLPGMERWYNAVRAGLTTLPNDDKEAA